MVKIVYTYLRHWHKHYTNLRHERYKSLSSSSSISTNSQPSDTHEQLGRPEIDLVSHLVCTLSAIASGRTGAYRVEAGIVRDHLGAQVLIVKHWTCNWTITSPYQCQISCKIILQMGNFGGSANSELGWVWPKIPEDYRSFVPMQQP